MSEESLKPGILWGQHRNTELVAMAVKERLEQDPEVSQSIPFVEYELFQLTDYVELLYAARDAVLSGMPLEEFWERCGDEMAKQFKDYEHALRQKHGSLLFNLHDGTKSDIARKEIQFLIPPHAPNGRRLEQHLYEVASSHGIEINVEPACVFVREDGGRLVIPDSITVEFMSPYELRRFMSREIESLFEDYHPPGINKGYELLKMYFKAPDVSHPKFRELVERYAPFMKDVLLGI